MVWGDADIFVAHYISNEKTLTFFLSVHLSMDRVAPTNAWRKYAASVGGWAAFFFKQTVTILYITALAAVVTKVRDFFFSSPPTTDLAELILFNQNELLHEYTSVNLVQFKELRQLTEEIPLREYLANHNGELVWYRAYAVPTHLWTYWYKYLLSTIYLFGPWWLFGWQGASDKTICVRLGKMEVEDFVHSSKMYDDTGSILRCRLAIFKEFYSMQIVVLVIFAIITLLFIVKRVSLQ